MLKTFGKIIGKIAAVPALLLVGIFWLLAKIAYHISGSVLIILMMFMGIGVLYYVVLQEWHNVIFLGCAEAAGATLLFGAAFIICISETIRDGLTGFLLS